MIRTQIQLNSEQSRRIKKSRSEEEISMAESSVVRFILARDRRTLPKKNVANCGAIRTEDRWQIQLRHSDVSPITTPLWISLRRLNIFIEYRRFFRAGR
jgi:hypothetical protein